MSCVAIGVYLLVDLQTKFSVPPNPHKELERAPNENESLDKRIKQVKPRTDNTVLLMPVRLFIFWFDLFFFFLEDCCRGMI